MSGSSAKTLLAKIPAREWRGLVPEWEGGRLKIPLVCGTCGTTDHWTASRVIGPQTAIPKIIQLGWRVDGKLICPICVATHGKPKLKLIEANMTNVAKLDTPKLLDDQKRNKRLVILALEEEFNESTRQYREGKSDKTIADDLGLSPGFVKTVREEFYGQLAEPKELDEVRQEISAFRKLIDDLESRLSGMCTRNGWKA